jgi:hypothetical protein
MIIERSTATRPAGWSCTAAKRPNMTSVARSAARSIFQKMQHVTKGPTEEPYFQTIAVLAGKDASLQARQYFLARDPRLCLERLNLAASSNQKF